MRVQKAIYIRHKSCPAAAHRGIRHEGTHKICQPRFSRAGSSGVPRKRRPISSTCRARSRRLLTVGCGNWPRAVPQRRVQSDLQPPTNPVDDHREEWLGAARSDDRSRIKALQSSVAEGADRWDVEYRIIGPDGDVRWLHERTFPVATLRGATFRVAGIAEPITALKKSLKENTHYEAQLQKLTRELDQAREKEQHRIVESLHHDVGQNLAVIRIRPGQLGKELPAEQKEFLKSTAEFIQQKIDSTRNLMVKLSPAPLYERGFWPTVDRLASQVTAQSGIEVGCENLCPETKVNFDTAIALFQIVRELLHSYVKHSGMKAGRRSTVRRI